MSSLLDLVTWEGLLFLGALFVIVLVRILTGKIQVRDLLDGIRADGTRFVSAGRTQLLIVTAWVTANCGSQIVQNPGKFPDISQNSLVLFGGSQLLYLGSKYYSLRRN